MADLFWLSDEQWAVMEPLLPKNQPGPERNDDRQFIPDILHVLTSGCRWRDCPAAYGPREPVGRSSERRSGTACNAPVPLASVRAVFSRWRECRTASRPASGAGSGGGTDSSRRFPDRKSVV